MRIFAFILIILCAINCGLGYQEIAQTAGIAAIFWLVAALERKQNP